MLPSTYKQQLAKLLLAAETADEVWGSQMKTGLALQVRRRLYRTGRAEG